MYTREENIPEENLDWEKSLEKRDNTEVQNKSEESKKIIHPATEENKIVFKKKMTLSQLSLQGVVKNLLDEHGEISFLLALLILPYVIGFIVVSFILLYGHVPIDRFFSLKEGIFHFELWSIGAYILITVGVIWLVILLLQYRR